MPIKTTINRPEGVGQFDPLKVSSDRLAVERARRHLLDFTTYTFPGYQTNWHHRVMCEYLERWAFGDLKRLMIFMPPRSGKSELVSRRLVSWLFGRNPNLSIIVASYSSDLASAMNRDVQNIIDDDAYQRVFPQTELFGKNIRAVARRSYLRNSSEFEIVNKKGAYKCAGVGSGITGRGFTHGIIDDPVKDRVDAESQAMSKRLWEWYTSTFYSRRMTDDARILITLTRWSERDLAGKLLDLAKSNPDAEQWTVVSFPMVAEDPLTPGDPRKIGDALWPERFSLESLVATKIAMGPYDWSALMQQRPTVPGGAIFDRSWWRFYHVREDIVEARNREAGMQLLTLYPENFDDQVQSWDLNFGDEGKDPSYVVGTVWGRVGADRFLLDMYRKQVDFPETLKQFEIMSQKWPLAVRKLVENRANGQAMISSLRHKIPGIIPVNPRGSKEIRARAAAPVAESKNIYLPHPDIQPWVSDFIDELADFPSGRHNDIVDTVSQYLNNTQLLQPVVLPKVPSKVVHVGSSGWRKY